MDPIKKFVQLSNIQVNEQDARVEELMGKANGGRLKLLLCF